MRLLSRTNRPYLLAGVVLLLAFAVLQVAEVVRKKLAPPASETAASAQPVEPPEPIRPEVQVQGNSVMIDVAGYQTTIASDRNDPAYWEAFGACLDERLPRALAESATHGPRRNAPLPLFKGYGDRKQIHEPVSAVIRECTHELDRQSRSQPSDS